MSGQQFWWSHKFREWKSTAYGLIFPRKPSNVFICMLPLWVYQIPSVFTANIYLIERQGDAFYAVCFSRHQDLQRPSHNWDDYFHTEILLHGLWFSNSENLFQFKCSLHSYRNIYILEVWLHDDKWKGGEIWAMYTSANDVVGMDWNVWHWESHIHVVSESILQSGFSADSWADWFIILDLLHFSI